MTGIDAVTLATRDMAASVAFWTVPGFPVVHGGPEADFTTVRVGHNHVNLLADPGAKPGFWGRFIIHVDSPDDTFRRYLEAGYACDTEPADAPWGERYFQISDPSGHQVSFARRLDQR